MNKIYRNCQVFKIQPNKIIIFKILDFQERIWNFDSIIFLYIIIFCSIPG